MSETRKGKFLVKTVKFAGKEITLYSLDGFTWSTRRAELAEIKERQEREKVTFTAIKEDGEASSKIVVAKPVKPAASGDEEDMEEIYDDGDDLPDYNDDQPVYNDEAGQPARASGKKGRGANAPQPVKQVKSKEGRKAPQVHAASAAKAAKAPARKDARPKAPAKASKSQVKVTPKKRATGKPAGKVKARGKTKKKAA